MKNTNQEPNFFTRLWETKAGKLAISGLIFFISVWLVSLIQPAHKKTVNTAVNFDAADALLVCQSAIKLASKDAEKTQVPYVPDQGSAAGYFFAWNNTTKLVRMPNGLGIEIGVTALCKIDKETKKINSLIIDGNQLI